jgi:hypothetical protein
MAPNFARTSHAQIMGCIKYSAGSNENSMNLINLMPCILINFFAFAVIMVLVPKPDR